MNPSLSHPFDSELHPRIVAPTEKEAVEWALVLDSQAIGCAICRDPESHEWHLLVREKDHDIAREHIRKYLEENQGWKLPHALRWTKAPFFHPGGILWCLLLIAVHGLVSGPAPGLKEIGVMTHSAFAEGEGWRIFTAMTLHGDWSHLASNVTTGIILLGLAMGRFGAGIGLLAAWFAGAGGNLISWFLYDPPYQSLGASGMVLGALGLITVESLAWWRRTHRGRKRFLASVGAGFMLFVLFGTHPGTDFAAHAGGFFCGCLIGWPLALCPRDRESETGWNILSVSVLFAIAYSSWWLAMTTAAPGR